MCPDSFAHHVQFEHYLSCRTGTYEFRKIRYKAVADQLERLGLTNDDIVVDVGAGWTDFDYFLRTERHFHGRYLPVDAALDGTDLNRWQPKVPASFFVAIEVLEHLHWPLRLVDRMKDAALKGVVCTVPNPSTTDVLGMDPTHKTIVDKVDFTSRGFDVHEVSLFGKPDDSLLAVLKI